MSSTALTDVKESNLAVIQEYIPSVVEQSEEMQLFNEDGEMPTFDSLPEVSIIHKSQLFEMPNGTTTKSFPCIVLDAFRTNAYWKASFEENGGGEFPDCASLNNIYPTMGDNQQSDKCATCRQNKPGSNPKPDANKWSRACQNKYRLCLLIPSIPMPCIMNASTMSIKIIDKFIKDCTMDGKAYQAFKVILSLNKQKTYSVLNIDRRDHIEEREAHRYLASLKAQYHDALHSTPIVREEGEE